jgi:hypothetical protein
MFRRFDQGGLWVSLDGYADTRQQVLPSCWRGHYHKWDLFFGVNGLYDIH